MASPQSGRFALTPATPTNSRVLNLKSPLSDETIWKRLHEAGFDEESIKRRDKASLIAHIAKLEAEIYNLQNQMGILIMEKKEWVSNYEQMKSAADSAELTLKRDHASHMSALAEAKKREESLKKALGIEKECVSNIEKALHEMRAECAEAKVAADIKLAEARTMMEDALKKMTEANSKKQATESLEAEASRYHRAAERKLHEVEAREDDLRRQINSFKSDCDAKEKEILLERQSLCERQKSVQQSEDRLVDGQTLLNQREVYIISRSEEISRLEKELQASRLSLEQERKAVKEEKLNMELKAASLAARDEDIAKRENELKKKYKELHIQQEEIASKESDRIKHTLANHEVVLKERTSQIEAQLEAKRKLMEENIENKRRASELREVELIQREDLISEKEHDLEVQAKALGDKEKDLSEKLNAMEEKEKSIIASERNVALQKDTLQKEKEEINRMKNDLQKSLTLLHDKSKQVSYTKEKVEAMRADTNELMLLEGRLKEEIDLIRAQKHELEVEADQLKAEKAKFETEWELIDEKREELRIEAERIAEERVVISKFLKDERDCLKLEKDITREQYKKDVELLSRDRETFMKQIEQERSDWFSKIQKERTDFVLDIELQKKELENCIEKRREEIEGYLREKEKAFEEEKKKELEKISSLKEIVAKEAELVKLEMKKLDAERKEINMGHERRDKEWAELNDSIEELKVQRHKLEKQRELLHADREEILAQIENLKKLEDIKGVSNRIVASEIEECDLDSRKQSFVAKKYKKNRTKLDLAHKSGDNEGGDVLSAKKEISNGSPPASTALGWLKRCASSLLEQTQGNKKRKQLKEGNESEENIIPSAKETTVYIDKIITIREVTSVSGENVIETSQGGERKLEHKGDLGSDNTKKSMSKKLKGQVEDQD